MKVLPRKRRLAGCTALALILSSAAAVAAGPAQARVTAIPIVSHVVASWGDGVGLGAERPRPAGPRRGGQRSRGHAGRVAVLNRVTKISAGRDFGLALRSDGIVFAWGDNGLGQLGNGTVADGTKPVKIAGLAQVTGISAGWDSSLATETSGISAVTSVWAWGSNESGQLGDGTLTGHFTPKRVTGLPVSIAGISVGGQFATVLGTDGSVWGWGTNGSGQLNIAPSGAVVTRPVPTIVAGSGITQISAGGGHMLARRSDGTVPAWGLNGRGQLGYGSMAQVSGPVQVTGLKTPRRWPRDRPSASRSTPCGAGWTEYLASP